MGVNTPRCDAFITRCDIQTVMTVGERIQEARQWLAAEEKQPVSQAELARRCGWDNAQSRVSNYEKGFRQPGADDLSVIARITGFRAEYLQFGTLPKRSKDEAVADTPGQYVTSGATEATGYTMVPRYGVGISAGHGNHVEHEEVDHELAFRTDWLKRRDLSIRHLCVIHAHGDSMAPRIGSGDILLVDRSQTQVRDGKVYALRMGDDTWVKRLFWQHDGSLLITSDNPSPEYRDQTVPSGELENVHIIGRVVWAGVEM